MSGSDTIVIARALLEAKITECQEIMNKPTTCPDYATVCNLRGQISACQSLLRGTFGQSKVPQRPPGIAPDGLPIKRTGMYDTGSRTS